MPSIPFLSHEAPFTALALLLALLFILKPLKALRRSLINTSVFYAACLFGDLLAGLLLSEHSMTSAAGLLRQLADGVDQPGLLGILRLLDDLHAHHPLGRPLGDGERHERAAEAEHRGEHQQPAIALAVQGQPLVQARDPQDHGQPEDDGQVGQDEQQDALHGVGFTLGVRVAGPRGPLPL